MHRNLQPSHIGTRRFGCWALIGSFFGRGDPRIPRRCQHTTSISKTSVEREVLRILRFILQGFGPKIHDRYSGGARFLHNEVFGPYWATMWELLNIRGLNIAHKIVYFKGTLETDPQLVEICGSSHIVITRISSKLALSQSTETIIEV